MSEGELLRNQLAQTSRWPYADHLAPGIPSKKDYDVADRVLSRFDVRLREPQAEETLGYIVFARDATDPEWSADWDEMTTYRDEAEHSAKGCVEERTRFGLENVEAFVATVVRRAGE